MQRSSRELANPFLSPGFTIAAGRVRAAARVAVLEEGRDIVGFFPFEQGRWRIGRPIAAGVSDAQGVIHVPGLEWAPVELLKGCHLDVWEFDHLIGSQIPSTGQKVAGRSSPIIDVSQGYEAYVAQRASKRTFKSTFYKQRKLERDLGTTRFEFDSRDGHAFSVLLGWKSRQYRRTGHRDRFAIEWIRNLVWDLFEETDSHGCAGTLSVLYAAERVVAAHFGLRSDSSLSCWFPAYDPRLARYSPGLSLHLRMAAAAATDGLRHLDLGKGDEVYKQSLKTNDLTVGQGRIHRLSVAAVAQKIRRTPRQVTSHIIINHPRLRHRVRGTWKWVASLRSST